MNDATLQNKLLPVNETHPLIVIDTRLAQDNVHSGISRFVIGFSQAIADELAALHKQNKPHARILFVSKHEPPAWIVSLVKKYPWLASFWSGGPGAFARDYEKPIYAWSTFSLSKIDELSGGNFFWVAPGNFDRPLLLPSKRKRALVSRICQIVHDTIPMFHKEGMSFFFRFQFKLLVRRALVKLPRVFTVSDLSAAQLKATAPKRTEPIQVLSCGVDAIFGSEKRLRNIEKLDARMAFLKKLNPDLAQNENKNFLERLCHMKWVVGVGRGQKYKRWELAQQAVAECNKRMPDCGALFFRIASSVEDMRALGDGSTKPFGSGIFTQSSPMIAWPNLKDESLYELYRLADTLIHPSAAEGFGFPPLEAALSGLPVIFAKGTAVEGHFAPGQLPDTFWHPVGGSSVDDWLTALLAVLHGDASSKKFFDEMDRATSTRQFMLKYASRRFDWKEPALTFLKSLNVTN